MPTDRERLPGLLAKLNGFCQPSAHYSLTHYRRSAKTETNYIHYGYYLAYEGAEAERIPGIPWRDHSGKGRFIGTTATEARAYLQQMLNRHKTTEDWSGKWWQACHKRRMRRKNAR